MENEKVVRWLTDLEKGKRIVALLLIAAMALASVIVYEYFDNRNLQKRINELQNEKEKQIVECEQRAGSVRDIAAKALLIYMEKNDSINRVILKENQVYILDRINKVTRLTENLNK